MDTLVGMDDNTLQTEFNGRTITFTPLKGSQMQVLLNMKYEKDLAAANHTFLRVLEKAVGPDEWELINEDMLDGLEDSELSKLLVDLVHKTHEFNERKNTAPTEPADDIDAELRKAQELLARHGQRP